MGHDKQSDSDGVNSMEENEAGIDRAIESSDVYKKYKCTHDGCNARFVRPSKLARHIRLHTGERPYKCTHPGCDKAYTNSSHLKRHTETHDNTKKAYPCTKCSLMITHRHNLKRHYEQVHGENRKLYCKECNVNFRKKQHFNEHMSTHSGILISYTCEKCNKSFTTQYKFEKHKRMHDSRKTYVCTAADCAETFDRWLLLCAHKKAKHITEHRCNECDRVFLSKYQLKTHSQIHSENRTILACPYEKCPRVYYFKRNLTEHINSKHLGEKYYCDTCKVGFTAKTCLIRHIRRIHETPRKKKPINKKLQRKRRKDAGIPKKSMVSTITGVDLSPRAEKKLLERETEIKLSTENGAA